METSPKNYQAWVKVADAAGGELRGQIARTLASEYDADPASAGPAVAVLPLDSRSSTHG
ncbi:DNA-primase RepB domain-containing protein [Salmonella enterica]|uniref:DNA-primase RepB domain-containing protein n=1 Tax=Salmonella TaxID=590 RepID=UPI00314075C5